MKPTMRDDIQTDAFAAWLYEKGSVREYVYHSTVTEWKRHPQLFKYAYAAAQEGLIYLFQRRTVVGGLQYLAVKRANGKKVPVKARPTMPVVEVMA